MPKCDHGDTNRPLRVRQAIRIVCKVHRNDIVCMCAFSASPGGAISGIMASIVNYKGSTRGSLSALFILEIY